MPGVLLDGADIAVISVERRRDARMPKPMRSRLDADVSTEF